MMDPKRAAVEQFIGHVAMLEDERNHAKDSGRKFVPTDEQKIERKRLMRQVLAAFNTTAQDLAERLGVTPATLSRWRSAAHEPTQRICERLVRLAGGGDRSQSGENNPRAILERATPAMLDAFGISRRLFDELEWLQSIQEAAGFELSEDTCRALVGGYRRQKTSDTGSKEAA